MRSKVFFNLSALVLSVAGQTSFNNGLWSPSVTPEDAQQSLTTWTSPYVIGTITVLITSTVSCPTSYITTTSVTTTTVCSICPPQPCNSITTLCNIVTACVPVTTCTPIVIQSQMTYVSTSTCRPVIIQSDASYVTASTCTTVLSQRGVTWVPSTTCSTVAITGCSSPDPPATSYYNGYTTAQQQEQPYTTVTSGTIVYVVMPSKGAPAGQEIVSAAERFRDHDSNLMTNRFSLVVVMLALILI